jgi:F-type H+-transporting ATPase subunit gamma
METLEALSERLNTTEEIQSIVRTMKALSSVNIRQYEHAVTAIADYERTITLGLQVVLRNRRNKAEPLDLTGPAGKTGHRRALIVVGSDRGLCGRFNDRIAEFAAERLETEAKAPDERPPLICVVGVRAAARLEALDRPADRLFTLPGSVEGLIDSVQSIVVELDRWVLEESVGPVALVYNRRSDNALAETTHKEVLPISQDYLDRLATTPWPSNRLPMFRMEEGELFSWLIRQHLTLVLYAALAESLASEHASRLAAMQNAERNIDERRENLLAEYRKKRQETITNELLEVVAGAEAIRKKK